METKIELEFNKLQKLAAKDKLTSDDITRFNEIVESLPNIDDSIKQQYQSDALSLLLVEGADEIDASEVKVGEGERHLKVNKKKVAKIAATTLLVGSLVIAGTTLFRGCSRGNKNNNIPTQSTIEQDVNVIKPTLAFDAENTDVLIDNIEVIARDMISKGIAMEDATLEETVESLTNYYVWMNLNEMGPTYLSKLYQTDSVSYIEIFQDAMYWANAIRFDSITSSKENNTVLDMSNFIASKKDAALAQEFLNINGRLSDAVAKNDKTSIDAIVSEYRTLIETKLLDHSSYTYGGGTMDLCFRLVYTGEQLLANYDITIMDEGLSKIINEDEFLRCYSQIVVNTKDSNQVIEVKKLETIIQDNTSKKSDNVVYIVDTLKDYINRLNMSLDFKGEKSIANVMMEVSKDLRDNNIIDTYVANMSIEEFFNKNYDLTHPKLPEVPDNSVVVDNGNHYVDQGEMDKHNSKTEEEYKENVKNETEEQLKDENTFKDNEGNTLDKGEDAEDYATAYVSGYEAGSRQGAIDGNALSTFNSNVSGSEGYKAGYQKGYTESYNEAKAKREAASKESTTTVTPVENGETKDEVIAQGPVITTSDNNQNNVEKPSIGTVIDEVVIEQGSVETNNSGTLPPVGTVIEEEVIEQGTVNYTLTEDELYQIYYEILYGTNDVSVSQNVKTK